MMDTTKEPINEATPMILLQLSLFIKCNETDEEALLESILSFDVGTIVGIVVVEAPGDEERSSSSLIVGSVLGGKVCCCCCCFL